MREIPGSTVMDRSSALIDSTRFIPDMSIVTPPCTASKWPSCEDPLPYGMIGTWYSAQEVYGELHLLRAQREYDRVGQLGDKRRFAAAMVHANCLGDRDPIAQFRLEQRE